MIKPLQPPPHLYDEQNSVEAASFGPLDLAEEARMSDVAHRIGGFGTKDSLSFRSNNAWGLVELGLCSNNFDHARASFALAKVLFNSISNHPDVPTASRLRASYAERFVPVFYARRAEVLPSRGTWALAFGAIGASITDLLKEKIIDAACASRQLVGILGELGVAGLITYGGDIAYPASDREDHTRSVNLPIAHDCYQIEDGNKVPPVQVKYKAGSKRNSSVPYDTSRVVVICYADICRKVSDDLEIQYPEDMHPAHAPAITVARSIATIARGDPLSVEQEDLLAGAYQLVSDKIDKWRDGRSKVAANLTGPQTLRQPA